MDKKWKLGALGGAGLVVATLAAVGSAAFGGTPQQRDTVPAGQIVVDQVVREPVSTTAGTFTVDAPTTAPVPATTPGQPAPNQPRAVNNDPVTTNPQPQPPAPTPTAEVPRDQNGNPVSPPTPAPPDPSRPGNPNGVPNPDPTPTP